MAIFFKTFFWFELDKYLSFNGYFFQNFFLPKLNNSDYLPMRFFHQALDEVCNWLNFGFIPLLYINNAASHDLLRWEVPLDNLKQLK